MIFTKLCISFFVNDIFNFPPFYGPFKSEYRFVLTLDHENYLSERSRSCAVRFLFFTLFPLDRTGISEAKMS